MTKRDPFFDLLKFIAMFLVVLSHVIFYRPGYDITTMPSSLLNFILSMNMPLFFMISGYFSRRLHESGDWKKLGRRLVTYFWPLAAVSFILLCFETIVLHEHSFSQIPLLELKAFLSHGWFFYALAICEVGTFCAYRWGKTRYKIIAICGLEALVLILMSGKIWHTSNTTAMIGFYWFGLACLPAILSNKKAFTYLAGISAAVVLVSQLLMENIATNGLGFYWDSICLYHFHWTQITNQLLRLLLGVAGSLAVMGVLKVALKYLPRLSVLSFLGTQTLAIYYLQGTVITRGSNHFVSLSASPLIFFIAAVCVYLVCVGIITLSKTNRWSNLLLWGPK